MSELLQERAYKLILNRIASGVLPPGERLLEPELAKEIGISRMPVRDAVTQLRCEGLIERLPRYGTFVRQLEEADIRELYELREGLESFAAGLAAERISEEDLAKLRRLMKETRRMVKALNDASEDELKGDAMGSFLATDMGFHTIVIQASGNSRIMKVIAQSHILSSIFSRQRVRHGLVILRKIVKNHGRILKALERRDPAAAAEAVAIHIRQSKRNSLAGYRTHRDAARQRAFDLMPEDVVRELNRIESEMTTNK